MPNAKVLSEKQAIVEELTRRLSSASAGVFVDYRGITVAEDTQLRRELAQNAVQYSVVKNTLTKFAVDKVGLEGLDPALNGTTSMATSEGDPIAPIRIISEYSKKMGDRFNIKAAFMDGKVLGAQEIEEIAANGPKSEDIEKNREFMLKSWKNSLEQNASWMNYLNSKYGSGLDYLADYEEVLKTLTDADVQAMAKKVLSDGNLVKVIMRPAKEEAK